MNPESWLAQLLRSACPSLDERRIGCLQMTGGLIRHDLVIPLVIVGT